MLAFRSAKMRRECKNCHIYGYRFGQNSWNPKKTTKSHQKLGTSLCRKSEVQKMEKKKKKIIKYQGVARILKNFRIIFNIF